MVAEKLNIKKTRSVVLISIYNVCIRSSAFTFTNCETLYFSKNGEKSTGTYRFDTGSYVLTVTPTDFQKLMDILLARFRDVFVFIDDILIITKGTKSEHLEQMRKV